MLFADKQYPVNVKNGKSFVYPANSLSLGDNILMTIISQAVFRDNPGEDISLVPFSEDIVKLTRAEKPDKVFLRMDSTCVTDREIKKLKRLTQVFEFELHKECHGLWQQGIYPKLNVKSGEISDFLYHPKNEVFSRKSIVFHIRNVNKIPSKNTDPEFVKRILYQIVKGDYDFSYIVLVGNDESYGRKIERLRRYKWKVIDFRHKLTRDEIYHFIKVSKLFIGSDSGICHLASCCNVPMVCWGFQNEYWFPKVRDIDQCLFLTKEESDIDAVLNGIDGRLRGSV